MGQPLSIILAGAGNARPHAVLSIAGVLNHSDTYDDNGNMTSGADRAVTWASFNNVTKTLDGGKITSFIYGAQR